MTKEEKFLALYNDLDELLRKRYNNMDRTQSVLVRFINELNKLKAPLFIDLAKKLNMIRVIRNNLIHELDMNRFDLIEISDETIETLTTTIKMLQKPKRVKDIARPISEAFILRYEENPDLNDTIRVMREKGYTQVPVLNKDDNLVGVFSPNVIFEYLAKHENLCINQLKIKDLQEFLAIDKHFSETYIFAKEDMLEEDIDDEFMDYLETNKKPAMVFATSDGTKNGKVKGILVLKDLLDTNRNTDDGI